MAKKTGSRPTPRASRVAKASADSKRPDSRRFLPEVLDRTVIAVPLLNWFKDPEKRTEAFDVVIDLNWNYYAGRAAARKKVEERVRAIIAARKAKTSTMHLSGFASDDDVENEGAQYVFARLDAEAIRELARRDSDAPREQRAIHHIWPDFPLKTLINKSISTVKADAAHNSFAAGGSGIVWAVDRLRDRPDPSPLREVQEPGAGFAAGAPRLHGPWGSARGRQGTRYARRRDHRWRVQRRRARGRKGQAAHCRDDTLSRPER